MGLSISSFLTIISLGKKEKEGNTGDYVSTPGSSSFERWHQ
jgi:hypothetical protein